MPFVCICPVARYPVDSPIQVSLSGAKSYVEIHLFPKCQRTSSRRDNNECQKKAQLASIKVEFGVDPPGNATS